MKGIRAGEKAGQLDRRICSWEVVEKRTLQEVEVRQDGLNDSTAV